MAARLYPLLCRSQEAYVNGVSTRKMDSLTKTLGIESISRGQVSVLTEELNEQVEAFQQRKLEATYPVLWVDALYERIRDNRAVKNMAVLVVTGINTEGKRDILAVEPMYEESTATHTKLFENLKERGIKKVWLVISDAHKGLVKAARESFVGCSWQRCKVHFMRNILGCVSSRDKKYFAEKLKQIWLQPDYDSATKYADWLMNEYEGKYPQAIATLEEGLEDASRKLARPIEQLASAAEAVANGDLTVKINIKSADEVGVLGNSMNEMVQKIGFLV